MLLNLVRAGATGNVFKQASPIQRGGVVLYNNLRGSNRFAGDLDPGGSLFPRPVGGVVLYNGLRGSNRFAGDADPGGRLYSRQPIVAVTIA